MRNGVTSWRRIVHKVLRADCGLRAASSVRTARCNPMPLESIPSPQDGGPSGPGQQGRGRRFSGSTLHPLSCTEAGVSLSELFTVIQRPVAQGRRKYPHEMPKHHYLRRFLARVLAQRRRKYPPKMPKYHDLQHFLRRVLVDLPKHQRS